ncbi:MAG: FtsX-like permease family protein [Proteobacteria bacterium]|nr:FtsX-like permease family protein [Pseudomonadota bacterium]
MNFLSELREGLFIAWDSLRANKLRSALTTLGIVIGIVTVTLMGTALAGLNAAFLKSISAIGTDVFFVAPWQWFSDEPWWKMRNRRPILLADARALVRQTTFARATTIDASRRMTVRYRDLSATSVNVSGTTEGGAEVGGLVLKEGRFLSAAEVEGARPVCVIGADIAANFFPYESPLGKHLRVEDQNLEIIGVLEKRGSFLGMASLDNEVMLPVTKFVSDFSFRPPVMIRVKVRDLKEMDEAREEIRGIMRKIRHLAPGVPDDFAINEQAAFIQTFDRMNSVVAGAGLFITSLSLFVGGIGIMNIMFVTVAERTREIGIRKAIGAKRRAILTQFLLESALICLLGGLLGLAFAYPITLVMDRFMPAALSASLVGIALLVSVATGVIAGFLPAWRAAKMNPVDALRAE